MNIQQSNAAPQATRNRVFTSILLRGLGLLLCAVIIVLFGLVPFLLGALAQAISPKRIPSFIVGLLAVGAFFALWHFTGWLSTTVGDGFPLWPSIMMSLVLFVAFFGSGAALLCELFPRRFRSFSTSPNTK